MKEVITDARCCSFSAHNKHCTANVRLKTHTFIGRHFRHILSLLFFVARFQDCEHFFSFLSFVTEEKTHSHIQDESENIKKIRKRNKTLKKNDGR